MDEVALYKAYIEVKNTKGKTITNLAEEFGITRNTLYGIIRRIENGNVHKIKECTEKSRLDCLWRYKYQARFQAIPQNRKESTIEALTDLMKQMRKDGFSASRIARLVKKDRSTVLHHLEK